MRTTQKAQLKSELAVQRSHRGITKDSYFLDGCAILWVVAWPCAKNAVVQDYIDAFREHVRRYQQEADVFLVFDRYVDGSTKEETRWGRDKEASKVFKMKLTSRLPAAKLLVSVTSNKIQIINYTIADFLVHMDDKVTHTLTLTGPEPVPVELPGGVVIPRRVLETTQEEADTILIHQVNPVKYNTCYNVMLYKCMYMYV